MVEVYSWNPLRRRLRGRVGSRIPIKGRVNNFGDLIGPIVVELMLQRAGIDPSSGSGRLLTVGSVLHQARTGDVIWGSGVNGKDADSNLKATDLDVRAVRGPLTRSYLIQRGFTVPEVYGDPALLLPELLPQLRAWAAEPKRHQVTAVPNLHDLDLFEGPRLTRSWHISPRQPVMKVLERIARSEFVAASSLHGIIVAESLGIPARGFRSTRETTFKYRDYYESTGRPFFRMAEGPSDALAAGGEPPPVWDAEPLLSTFPYDLWNWGSTLAGASEG